MMRRAAMVLASLVLLARTAEAKPVAPELLAKLAAYADSFEAEEKRASYHVDGKMEVLDGPDHVSETKEVALEVQATGAAPNLVVTRYIEDGVDKTADAVKKAKESADKRRKKRDAGKQFKMPIAAGEQERYIFDETEETPDGARALVHFTPKEKADDTLEGSAWVDVARGTVLSASFRPSKTSLFVRYVHFFLEFGAETPLGPAVSKVTVDGEGGVLFIRRHFRGTATLSGYALTL